jgi:hypothetical protein
MWIFQIISKFLHSIYYTSLSLCNWSFLRRCFCRFFLVLLNNTGFFTTDFGVSEQDFIASISIIFFASVAIMILAVRKKTQQKSQATLKRRK